MLTSTQNPLIKEIRKLQRPSHRHQEGLCLLEGKNLLEVALQVNYPLHCLLATPQWQEKYPDLWAKLQQNAERVATVSHEVMKVIATTVNPDGIVATAPRQLNNNIDPSKVKLGLVLETIQDPGNLGTIIRTSVGVGVGALWISGDSVDLDHPKVLRSSVGEWFKLPAKTESDLVSHVNNYRHLGFQIVATTLTGNLTPQQIDFSQPTLILLGNESQGLSSHLSNLATHEVKIPLANGVESLNVAIATAFLLAEYQRQLIAHK